MKENLKKMLFCVCIIVSILFILGIFTLTQAVSENKYLSISVLRERDNEIMGYRLKENSKVIWKIQERVSDDENIPPIKNQPAIYCLKGGLGFHSSGVIYNYDVSYNMLTEKEKIAEQNDVLYGLVNSGKWNKIIALLANMYAPGASGEEYRKILLEKVNDAYPGEYKHFIKDVDIEVINQLVLWSLTNSDEPIYTDNYSKTNLLEYTTDGTKYYDFSRYNEEENEGKERQDQMESLYKWLSDKAESYFLSGEIVEQTGVISSEEGCDLKKLPTNSSETISKLDKDTQITITRSNVASIKGKIWSFVKLEDETEGYITTDLYDITNYNEKCQVNTPSGTRIRKEPNTTSDILGSVANGGMVTRLKRAVVSDNQYTWDQIKMEDGTIGYCASKYLELIPNEFYDEGFQGIEKPLTVNTESKLTCEIKDSNYIVGPIAFNKNNDLLYSVDFDIKIGDATVEDYKVLNDEKTETDKKDITEGNYYLSVPMIGTNPISVDTKVNYESTELTLWATSENNVAQPVVYVSKENKTDKVSFEVDPEIELNVLEHKITKTGTESISSREDKVKYKIKYEAVIENYTGNVKVKLEDTLPYEIDETKSELADGVYDKESKKITWEINLDDINTFTEENKKYSILIEKEVSLLFKDIDVTLEKFTNNVKGKLILDDKDQLEDSAKFDTLVSLNGKVDVLYKDKDTNEEISDKKTKEGKLGTDFDVTEDKKDIEGYTLVEEPSPKKGTFEEEPQEKTYWYQKNTEENKKQVKLLVQHLENETNKKLADDEVSILNEGDSYSTKSKNITDYVVVDSKIPKNKEGVMGDEDITVTYYYEAVEKNNPQQAPSPDQQNTQIPSNSQVVTPSETPSGQNTLVVTPKQDPDSGKTLPITGDVLPVIAIAIIAITSILNIVQMVINKRKNKTEK